MLYNRCSCWRGHDIEGNLSRKKGSTMEYQDIIYQVDDPVAVITLNRPEALNAFTQTMLAEMRHAIAAAEQDERVVGIVITGAGRGF